MSDAPADIRVLLYYRFTPIADPEAFRASHEALCRRLGLRGRIYVAEEGLNGTCAGERAATEAYRAAVEAIPGFEGIHWKEDRAERVPFAKLRVRTRKTIVNLGLEEDVDPAQEGSAKLSPTAWREMLEGAAPYTLLDVRNGYEFDVGHFAGARRAPFEHFYEFPQWAESLDAPKDEPVLMYCTGGIRCEKYSGYLRRLGFEQVYQLDGGILGYAAEQGGAHFEGDCFVFDDRLRVDIGGAPTEGVTCAWCGTATTVFRNCANMDCHARFFCCDACAVENAGVCGAACADAPRLRKIDPTDVQRVFRTKGAEIPDLRRRKK